MFDALLMPHLARCDVLCFCLLLIQGSVYTVLLGEQSVVGRYPLHGAAQ